MVESPIDVFVEEPEVGSPVVSKEWTRSCAVLRDDQRHEGKRGDLGSIAYRLPHFVIPVQDSCPKKSLPASLHYVVARENWDVLTTALSGYPRGRNLCDQSPTRT